MPWCCSVSFLIVLFLHVNTEYCSSLMLLGYLLLLDHSVSFYTFFSVVWKGMPNILPWWSTHVSEIMTILLSVTYILLVCSNFINFLSLWLFLTASSPIFCDRYTRPISQIFRQRVHWFYPADTREIFLKLLKSKVSWLISVILK